MRDTDALASAKALLTQGDDVVVMREREERDPRLGPVRVQHDEDVRPILAALADEVAAARALVQHVRAREAHSVACALSPEPCFCEWKATATLLARYDAQATIK